MYIWCKRPTPQVAIGANIAQLVEHIHGKDEVDSSILSIGSFMFLSYFLKQKTKIVQTFFLILFSFSAYRYISISPFEYGVISQVFHTVNLIFHEAGHTLCSFFGEFIYILGGSLFQVLVPSVVAVYFLKRGETFSFSIILLWVATNVQEVAIYMADAQARVLPLLGDDPESHDWHALFQMTGFLEKSSDIASVVSTIAHFIFVFAVVFGLYIVWYDFVTQLYLKQSKKEHPEAL